MGASSRSPARGTPPITRTSPSSPLRSGRFSTKRPWQTEPMDLLGWIILGFIAGAVSGALVGGRTARGCLPNVIVGVLGAIVGGWLAQEFGFGTPGGLIAALVVAVLGAVVVRVILEAISPND